MVSAIDSTKKSKSPSLASSTRSNVKVPANGSAGNEEESKDGKTKLKPC